MAKPTNKPAKAGLEIIDCVQGSDEWKKARVGIITASCFSDVIAGGQGKTRGKYLYKLAGEVITQEPMENFSNKDMERGHEQEDPARALYCMIKDCEVQRIGFGKRGRIGASPDGLIGKDGGLEIKSHTPHLLIEYLLKDEIPTEHFTQVQGNMLVFERDWWDVMLFWPKMPPLIKRVQRDVHYIRRIQDGIDAFTEELDQLVAKLKRMGGK